MRWLRLLLLVVGVLCWFLLGYALGGARRTNETETSTAAGAAVAVVDPVTAPEMNVDEPDVTARPGVVTADERSEAGAVATAVSFLELTEEVVSLTPAEAAELQRSISTDEDADRLADEVEATMTDVAAAVPDGVKVTVAPLGARAVADGDGWRVSVWYVEVVAYGTELAVEQWRTATYTLEWHDNRWLMADLESFDGPTPVRPAAMVASPTSELVAAMEEMRDEGWAP